MIPNKFNELSDRVTAELLKNDKLIYVILNINYCLSALGASFLGFNNMR
jgi:hypothetical protein